MRRSTDAFNRCILALCWSSSVTLHNLNSSKTVKRSGEPTRRVISQSAAGWQNVYEHKVPEHCPQQAHLNPSAPLVHHGTYRHSRVFSLEPAWNNETRVHAPCFHMRQVCSLENTPPSCIPRPNLTSA